jgi:hypothetical protein
MSFQSTHDIERLVSRFRDCTLPCAEWTHHAHLVVGLWHARAYPSDEALRRVREGIKRYNGACGKENSATSGYHETITRLYMTLIERFLNGAGDGLDLPTLVREMLARLGHRELPFEYYTRERLLSVHARARWVEPDLRPLDGL